MQAKEIMTESPACCTPSESIIDAARQMRDTGCGLLPVVDDTKSMRLVGVLTDRDIVCRVLATGQKCDGASVQDAMSSGKLLTVRPDSSVDEVIEKMEEGQVRRIPVVDASNKVLGVISTADIAMELDDQEEVAEVFEEISEPTHTRRA